MPRYGPVSRRELVAGLRRLGCTGPYPGGNHEYLLCGERRIPIPNPHSGDISIGMLARILREAGVSRHEWENA